MCTAHRSPIDTGDPTDTPQATAPRISTFVAAQGIGGRLPYFGSELSLVSPDIWISGFRFSLSNALRMAHPGSWV